ncbi:MAG: hypothetical protein OJF49_004817 [Ktedonobacterales bacterium]|nr:MAG: hypothetical protein OJF49_004817 [Ktedonobacterales bacterium]
MTNTDSRSFLLESARTMKVGAVQADGSPQVTPTKVTVRKNRRLVEHSATLRA